jgi:hypothetical protein
MNFEIRPGFQPISFVNLGKMPKLIHVSHVWKELVIAPSLDFTEKHLSQVCPAAACLASNRAIINVVELWVSLLSVLNTPLPRHSSLRKHLFILQALALASCTWRSLLQPSQGPT